MASNPQRALLEKLRAAGAGLSADTAVATNGDVIFPGFWPWTASYATGGQLEYEEITGLSGVYRRSYTYNANGQALTIGGWVKQ